MTGTLWWTPENAPKEFATLYEYCIKDVEAERLLDKSLRDLSSEEQRIWEIDQRMNRTGIRIDEKSINNAIALGKEHLNLLKNEYQILTDMDSSPTQRKFLLEWIQKNDVDINDTQKATLRKLMASGKMNDNVLNVLDIVAESTKSSLAKLPKMLQLSKDGIMREILAYHAAHTGRWGGRGAQIQNFPRPTIDINLCIEAINALDYQAFSSLYPDVASALSSSLRGMIIPAPGCVFFVADFSQMEARVLAWLAGQQDVLDVFASGRDLYCTEASKIYGYEVDKKKHKDERQVGKVAVLALGYGGGIAAFANMSRGYGVSLLPVYESIWKSASQKEKDTAKFCYDLYLKNQKSDDPVSEPEGLVADIIKQRWRAGNPRIVQYWSDLENSAIEAVRTRRPVKCGGDPWAASTVTWFTYKEFLFCKLPSGRCMAYPYPKLVREKGEEREKLAYYSGRYGYENTYGGKLSENLTQAAQRDLLRDAIIRLEDKYPVAFHVHDEVVSQVEIGFGDIREYEGIMREQPAWAKGLPIGVEGWAGPRYGKG